MNKVFWFTGLSGAGKSVIAEELKNHLHNVMVLDGDVIRTGLNRGLGFSVEDRNENIRRISEVAKLGYLAGNNVIVAFISPIKEQRDFARSLIPEGDFIEIYVNTSLEICEERDCKGLYKKARSGELREFTGIDSPYEAPINSEISIDTSGCEPVMFIDEILNVSGITDTKEPHDSFIGRWCPFHKGHFAIMKKTYEKNQRPLLIFVRDTSFDQYPADYRQKMVAYSMKKMGIPATVQIISDIKSVNWGRGVGYEANMVDVAEEIKGISATEIRKRIQDKDFTWKDLVCDGVSEFIEKEGF